MRRPIPELTDDDLRRLAHLGGAVEQIAEAAGIDVAKVRSRLVQVADPGGSEGRGSVRVNDALCR